MSGLEDIKKALKDSGLIIPTASADNGAVTPSESDTTPIFCKIACVGWSCFWGSCAVGHCVLLCSSACTASNCAPGCLAGSIEGDSQPADAK